MKFIRCVPLILIALAGTARAGVSIEGPDGPIKEGQTVEFKAHSLVRLKLAGADPKAAIDIEIEPDDAVDRADTAPDVIQFAAPPGTYKVQVIAFGQRPDGSYYLDKVKAHVKVCPCDPRPPAPPGPGPGPNPTPPGGAGRLDPLNALGKIQFGRSGCTATVIGPRRPDGKWDVLTAAHCVRNSGGAGARGTMVLRGTSTPIPITVAGSWDGPDVCWCVTDRPYDDLPYALLARDNPPPGTPIWHSGYGIHIPGNREDGEVTGPENSNGMIQMTLNVSSGDSGGGIFRSDTNEVISTVCCTSGRGLRVSMYGGSTRQCNLLRPGRTSDESLADWEPIEIPVCRVGPESTNELGWSPVEIPICPEMAPATMHYIRKEDE